MHVSACWLADPTMAFRLSTWTFAVCSNIVHRADLTSTRHDSHHLALAFRVSTTFAVCPALYSHHRDDVSELQNPPPMSFSRPFDVYHHEAATYTRPSTVQLGNALDLCEQASLPLALDALLRLMTTHPVTGRNALGFISLQSFSLTPCHIRLVVARCPPCCFSLAPPKWCSNRSFEGLSMM